MDCSIIWVKLYGLLEGLVGFFIVSDFVENLPFVEHHLSPISIVYLISVINWNSLLFSMRSNVFGLKSRILVVISLRNQPLSCACNVSNSQVFVKENRLCKGVIYQFFP